MVNMKWNQLYYVPKLRKSMRISYSQLYLHMSCLWNLQQKDLGENFRQYRSTVWQCMTYSRNMLCITMTAKLYRENVSNIYLTQTETVEDGLQPTFLKTAFLSLLASHLWRICQFLSFLLCLATSSGVKPPPPAAGAAAPPPPAPILPFMVKCWTFFSTVPAPFCCKWHGCHQSSGV